MNIGDEYFKDPHTKQEKKTNSNDQGKTKEQAQKQENISLSHRTEINCLRCGKTGFADEEFCPYCGTKYPLKAIIIDFDMRFSSMVKFMVKWAFAAIPAIFIIFFLVILPLLFLSSISRVILK